MSRSNITEQSRNPTQRWFEWAAGNNGGFVRHYDKETKANEREPDKFQFIILDELATVKGWHDASESAIFANEVRDTRQDALVVRSFKGGELASGFYSAIRDRIKAVGGHFHASCYIAYKDGDELKIGNIGFKGASMAAWMEFKKNCPTKKDANGKTCKAYYVDAIRIEGFEELKKGGTTFRVPKFSLAPLSESSNLQAIGLDAEMQGYLTEYFKRPRAEAAEKVAAQSSSTPEDDQAPQHEERAGGDLDDDIPF